MAKSLEKIEARRLRREEGLSYKQISQRVKISKSTVSLWCRDIQLTEEQIHCLSIRSIDRSYIGRLKGANILKERRLALIEKCKENGKLRLSYLNREQFFVAGLALYWAEGYKTGRGVIFCNSDPDMMRFMINWFFIFFGLTYNDFKFRVDINEIHREREEIVKNYWIKTLSIPKSRFQKTSFKKVVNKKVYENFNEHYGTLRFELLRPTRVIYNLLGYIHGLSLVGNKYRRSEDLIRKFKAGSRLVSGDAS